MNSYKEKYLKYKSKYVNLKKQKGGATLEKLQNKIIYTTSRCINPSEFFRQHRGECWNDSIQMMLCFSDELKDSLQQKLFNLTPKEIIEMAHLNGRDKYLVPIYRKSVTNEEQNIRALKMEKRLEKYLFLLQSRLCLHLGDDIDTIPQCKHMSKDDEVCPLKETYGKFLVSEIPDFNDISDIEIFQEHLMPILDDEEIAYVKTKIADGATMEEIIERYSKIIKKQKEGKKIDDESPKMVLKRQRSEIAGIGSAVKGLKILNRREISLKNHGASDEEIISIINILSFSLLSNNNVLLTKKINPDELTTELIDNSLGMLVITPGHATSFYICDGVPVYFNDNFGKVKMDWKKLLKLYLTYKDTHVLILHWHKDRYVNILKNKDNEECIVLNTDAEIENEHGNVKDFGFTVEDIKLRTWTLDILLGLVVVKKENLEGKNDDEIYEKLEDQIVYTDMVNCSIVNIKDETFTKESLSKDIVNNVRKCDSGYLNNILGKINPALMNQDMKDEIFKNILHKDIFSDEDVSIAKNLIENGAKIIDESMWYSPFYIIARKPVIDANSYKLMDLLLKQGQDINQYNALQVAVEVKNIDLFKFFIKKGADVNGKYYDDNILCILMDKEDVNIYYEYINLLIEAGANLNIRTRYNMTPLELSSRDINLAKLIINKDVDLNEKFSNGQRPLLALFNHYDFERRIDVIKLLIEKGANVDTEILKLALYTVQPELFELILNKGVDVNSPIDDKPNSLFYILDRYQPHIKNVKIVKILIEHGINIEQKNENEATPLIVILTHYSIDDVHVEIFKLLLNANANITGKDKWGYTIFELVERTNNEKIKNAFDNFIGLKK